MSLIFLGNLIRILFTNTNVKEEENILRPKTGEINFKQNDND